jgi:hypothetical protein
MALLDIVWVKYTHATMKKWPVWAGFWAVCISGFVAVVTLNYVDNAWMIIPTAAGAFCGTFIATQWEQAI